MNRRNFLKLLGITPIAPGVLKAIPHKEPKELTLGSEDVIGFATEFVTKDSYGRLYFGSPYATSSDSMEIPDDCFVVGVSFDVPDDEPEQ